MSIGEEYNTLLYKKRRLANDGWLVVFGISLFALIVIILTYFGILNDTYSTDLDKFIELNKYFHFYDLYVYLFLTYIGMTLVFYVWLIWQWIFEYKALKWVINVSPSDTNITQYIANTIHTNTEEYSTGAGNIARKIYRRMTKNFMLSAASSRVGIGTYMIMCRIYRWVMAWICVILVIMIPLIIHLNDRSEIILRATGNETSIFPLLNIKRMMDVGKDFNGNNVYVYLDINNNKLVDQNYIVHASNTVRERKKQIDQQRIQQYKIESVEISHSNEDQHIH